MQFLGSLVGMLAVPGPSVTSIVAALLYRGTVPGLTNLGRFCEYPNVVKGCWEILEYLLVEDCCSLTSSSMADTPSFFYEIERCF